MQEAGVQQTIDHLNAIAARSSKPILMKATDTDGTLQHQSRLVASHVEYVINVARVPTWDYNSTCVSSLSEP